MYCIPCFWYVVLLLLFDSRCYLISLMMFSLTHWFFRPVLLNFYIFVNISVISLILILVSFSCYGFHPFMFVRLVLWLNMLCGLFWRKVHAGKRCVCSCCWVECLYRSVRAYWSVMFKSSLSLLVFCLIVPDIIESRNILVKVIQRT